MQSRFFHSLLFVLKTWNDYLGVIFIYIIIKTKLLNWRISTETWKNPLQEIWKFLVFIFLGNLIPCSIFFPDFAQELVNKLTRYDSFRATT